MPVRRRPVYAEFSDQFGEKQVIHRAHGRLSIRRKNPTVVFALSHAVGKHVGERVKAQRLAAGLTMLDLAEKAGLKGGKQAIYHVEQALNTGVRLGTLYAIAAALNVSPFEFLPTLESALHESAVEAVATQKLAV